MKKDKELTEDEIDLIAFEEAYKEFKKNPKTYTLDEVESMINSKPKNNK